MRYICVIVCLIVSFKSFSTRYYFNANTNTESPNHGSDSYTSTQAQDSATPWGTIGKLNSIFSSLNGGDSILLKRGGTFYTTTGIILNKSGGTNSPIVIAAYGTGPRPIVCGMTDLVFKAIGGGRPNIYVSQAIVADSINQVTVNNVPVEMGRWPNHDNGRDGYNTIHTSTGSRIVQTGDPNTTATSTSDNSQETYLQPTISVGAEVVYRADNFFIVRGIVTAYTLPNIDYKKKITGQANPVTSDNDKWGYFLQNDSFFLDKQNEWYFIRGSVKKVEMYSSTGVPTGVRAVTCQNLVYNSIAVSNINILNIDFNGCDNDIFFFSTGTCSKINISNCTIQNAGRNAINFDPCTYSSITSDSILNSLADGIRIGDNADYVNIKNNYMKYTGQLIGQGSGNTQDGRGCFSGDGIYVYHSGNAIKTDIQYNTIKYSAYAAVHFGRSDSTIVKYNFCDTALNVMDDGGIIYTYNGSYVPINTQHTDTTKKGRIIVGNVAIHGLGVKYGSGGTGGAGQGVSCIYNDKGSNNIIQDSNFCSGAEKAIFMNFGCVNMKVRGNTLYDCDRLLQVNTRQDDTTQLNVITGNICYAKTTAQLCFFSTALDNKSTGTYKPKPNLIGMFGIINNNFYLRPLSTSPTTATIIRIDKKASVFSDSLITFAKWRSFQPSYDANTQLTPFTYASTTDQTNNLFVNFNATQSTVFISTPGKTYKDIYGNIYSGTVTIAPYKSVIGFVIPEPPSNKIIKLRSLRPLPN